jgi:hypothetical protein
MRVQIKLFSVSDLLSHLGIPMSKVFVAIWSGRILQATDTIQPDSTLHIFQRVAGGSPSSRSARPILQAYLFQDSLIEVSFFGYDIWHDFQKHSSLVYGNSFQGQPTTID